MRISPIPVLSVFAVLLFSFSITAIASGVPSLPDQSRANWAIDRIDFVHYATPNGAKVQSGGGSCYKLMGVKWGTPNVPYTINPTNAQGLDAAFVTSAISTGAETWDANTSWELFNNAYTVNYSAQEGTLDNTNEIAFGPMSDNNVIAVTSVWYNRFTRKIVEFDMLLNTYYNWGDAMLDRSKMDLQNIATHELGHAVGMDDIYSTSCNTVTMYGYSGYGEIQKRTLEQPDINGLQKMYGA